MKVMVVASFALALALAAVLLSTWFAISAPSSGRAALPEAQAARPVQDTAALAAAVAELTETTAALKEQLVALEMRQVALENRPAGVPSGRQQVAPGADEVPADLEALRELAAAMQSDGAAAPSELQSLILAVVEGEEERERLAEEERRRTAALERVDERVYELQEVLGLTQDQSADMRRILGHEQIQRQDLFAAMREDGVFDRESMRDSWREIRDESRTAIEGVLAPDQYERYLELERDRGGRFGGGGFGVGGGGRGGSFTGTTDRTQDAAGTGDRRRGSE